MTHFVNRGAAMKRNSWQRGTMEPSLSVCYSNPKHTSIHPRLTMNSWY